MKVKTPYSQYKMSLQLTKGFQASLILLLAILVILGQSTYAASADSGQVTISKAQQPADNPFDSDSRSEELGSFDERDAEDSDEEWSRLFLVGSSVDCRIIASQHHSLSSVSQRFLNRPAVSLIVLHHAWKSSIA